MKTSQALCLLASLLASANANGSFISESPTASFLRVSSNKNDWDYDGKSTSWAICVIGYAVFIVTYLFVVVALFYDVTSKIREYSEMIEDDKVTLQRMNFDINNVDFLKSLENRINGIKEEEGADDQLLGEAAKLEQSQYSEYLN